MAVMITLDVSEVKALGAHMEAHAGATEAMAARIVAKAGFDTVRTAQAVCPVDTGNLKNSIGVDINGLSFTAGPTAEYGVYVELGTSKMSPQPYLFPAFGTVVPKVESALGQWGERCAG